MSVVGVDFRSRLMIAYILCGDMLNKTLSASQ
jgi:hypothetical protein